LIEDWEYDLCNSIATSKNKKSRPVASLSTAFVNLTSIHKNNILINNIEKKSYIALI
jgi:hypothetical protein